MLRPCLTLAVAALLAIFAAGAAAVEMKPELVEGETIVTYVENKTNQVLTVGEADLESGSQMLMNVRSEVGKRDDDGKLPVRHSFDSVRFDLGLPGGIELTFESGGKNDDLGDPQRKVFYDFFKHMAGMRWTSIHDESNRVVAIDKVTPFPDHINPMFKETLEPSYLLETARQQEQRVPDEPVSRGDAWTREVTSRLGGGQSMTIRMTYTYEGPVQRDGVKLEKVTGKADRVEYAMDPSSPSPLKVKDSDLKVTETESVYFFDRAKGRIIESRDKVRIQGELKFSINGNPTPGKLDLTMQSRSHVQPAE